MTDIDRDTTLLALFAEAGQELDPEVFMARVTSQIGRQKRRENVGRICIGLLLILTAWLLAAPLEDGVHLLTQALTLPVMELDNRLMAQILSPTNSIGSMVALGLIGLLSAYRRIFR